MKNLPLFAQLESFPDASVLFSDLRRSRLAYTAYYILSPYRIVIWRPPV